MTHWSDIYPVLAANPGREVLIPRSQISPPWEAGFRPSVGIPHGERSQWRMTDARGGCLHALDCGDAYRVHYDLMDPKVSFIGHVVCDLPWSLIALGLAILAVGLSIGGMR